MSICYIALGSNLNKPEHQLNQAKKAISQIAQTAVTKCSSIYKSEAITLDGKAQPDYLNAVIQVDTGLTPEALLDALQLIENQQGRVREERWGARTIDLDIVLFADQTIQTDRLIVPHPEMNNRNFVLYPLYQISPELGIPGGKSLKELLPMVSEQSLIKMGEFNG